MRSALVALESDVAEMQAMANAIEPANRHLAIAPDEVVRAYLLIRRRFDYAALIVALYAAFERFVEDMLKSYVRELAARTPYASLPSKVVEKNLRKTAELLARGELDQSRYGGLTPAQLVRNLFGCLAGNENYELNPDAVVAHDRNIRFAELSSLLGLVGISHVDVCRTDPLVDWYIDDQGLAGPRPTEVPTTVVETKLDDFVLRRNDVAHRGGNPSNRLGPDDMRSLINFVLALSRSILTLFASAYLNRACLFEDRCIALKMTKGPFKQQTVRVVQPPEKRMFLRQPAFALSPLGFLARWGRVQSLQLNGVPQDAVEPGVSVSNVGIGLDFRAPVTSDLFLMVAEDDLVWSDVADGSIAVAIDFGGK